MGESAMKADKQALAAAYSVAISSKHTDKC
jgi:hypothetical protein